MLFKFAALHGLGVLPLAAHAAKYGFNHVTVRRDPAAVTAAFTDVDIDLFSPAFLAFDQRQPGFGEGTQGPTSHEAMEKFMEEIAARNKDYMTYSTANFTSEEGRTYPFVHLSTARGSDRRRSRDNDNKVRIWIQGATHGNEPASDESLLALLGKFDNDPAWASYILSKTDIVVLPRNNPDGVSYFQRTLATNFDPNRDHIKLARQQTRSIKSLLNEYNPHVIVDMHEYGATASYGKYYQGSDSLFSAAKNLNINKDIRNISEALFAKNMGTAMENAGLRWEPYVTGPSSTSPDFVPQWEEAGTDGKIGRNAMGLTQAVTFLIETRGIFLADQEFQRRTASALTMCTAIIQTAADDAEQVYDTIESGRRDFAESTEPIVITDYSESGDRLFTMVDKATGEVAKIPVKFTSTTPAIANLTRARPEAYLIPVAWADVAERLRVAGLEIEELGEAWTGAVEALTIESAILDSSYYEGVVRVTTTTSAKDKQITLPKGSFLITTRQKNAALAFIALEPENIDSYASFNIIPVEEGDEYPVFRVMGQVYHRCK